MKKRDIIKTRGYKVQKIDFFDNLSIKEKHIIEEKKEDIEIYGEEAKTIYIQGKTIQIKKQPTIIDDRKAEEETTRSSVKIDKEIKKLAGKNKKEATDQIANIKENLVGIANAINVSYEHIEQLQQTHDEGQEGLQQNILQVEKSIDATEENIRDEIKGLSDLIVENEKANNEEHIAIKEEIKKTNKEIKDSKKGLEKQIKETNKEIVTTTKRLESKSEKLSKTIEKIKTNISTLVSQEEFFAEVANLRNELDSKSMRGHKHEIADITGLSAILKKLQKESGNTTTIVSKMGGTRIDDMTPSTETTYSSSKVDSMLKLQLLQSRNFYVDTIVNNQVIEAHRDDTTAVVNTYNGDNKLHTVVYTFPNATTTTLTITYNGDGNVSTALFS